MANPTSIKEAFQGIQTANMNVVEGEVLSVSPIRIRLLNDHAELGEHSVVIPESLKGWSSSCDISGGDISLTHARITVHSSLTAGDRVVMISYHNGKRYLIMGKV